MNFKLTGCLLVMMLMGSLASHANFRASVVKVDITPDVPKMLLGYSARQSTGILDRIYHRIVVLDDGNTKFFLVSSDLCVISPSEYDKVAALVQKKFNVNKVNFWWSLTHTHSAPEVGVPGLPEVFMGERYKHPVDTAYTHFVEQSLISGIEEAIRKLEPAKLAAGWGFSQANINRRAWDIDGRAAGGMNPDNPTDRRIGLLRLEKQDGKPMAIIANYAIHGTVLGQANHEISGDAPGVVSEYVEQKTGVPLLFINGAAGNLAPIYSVYPNAKAGHLGQFRVLLGDPIIKANEQMSLSTGEVVLYTGNLVVTSPLKPGMNWPVDLKEYLDSSADKKFVKVPVNFLRINNDIAIWAAPLELFCEISNEIRDRSPFPFTFYYGYTNGWLGYLATEKEWQHKGYEVETVSPFTISVEKDFKEPVAAYLASELSSMHTWKYRKVPNTQKATIKNR